MIRTSEDEQHNFQRICTTIELILHESSLITYLDNEVEQELGFTVRRHNPLFVMHVVQIMPYVQFCTHLLHRSAVVRLQLKKILLVQ